MCHRLCPRGDTYESNRIYQAIALGSIPLVETRFHGPLHAGNWTQFSSPIRRSPAGGLLLPTSAEEIRLRLQLSRAASAFDCTPDSAAMTSYVDDALDRLSSDERVDSLFSSSLMARLQLLEPCRKRFTQTSCGDHNISPQRCMQCGRPLPHGECACVEGQQSDGTALSSTTIRLGGGRGSEGSKERRGGGIPLGSGIVDEQGPQCYCFSACNSTDLANFLSRRPETIASPDNPWYRYLATVYGSLPHLPVSLSQFNFFYHADSEWSNSVEWPMASCRGLVGRPCSRAVCSRWRTSEGGESQGEGGKPQRKRKTVAVLPSLFVRGVARSAATLIFEAPLAVPRRLIGQAAKSAIEQANGLLGHHTLSTGGWREVIRRNHLPEREGTHGYGCWLWPATGSGIWVNLGRTLVVHRKDVAEATLARAWWANSSIDHNASLPLMRRIRAQEGFTVQAGDLGYDSVQVQYNFGGHAGKWAEIVLTSPPCMHGRRALRTCLPPLIEVRAGWGAEIPCTCDDELPLLNCKEALRPPDELARVVTRGTSSQKACHKRTANDRCTDSNACVRKCATSNSSDLLHRVPKVRQQRSSRP